MATEYEVLTNGKLHLLILEILLRGFNKLLKTQCSGISICKQNTHLMKVGLCGIYLK